MAQKTFSISDYDVIGFDLDNTLLEYDIAEMSRLIYNILARFLTEQRSYLKKYLLLPYEDGIDLLQRGLAMDFVRGNIVKLDPHGGVTIACHGSRLMTYQEIQATYGADRVWADGEQYMSDILQAWNGPLGNRIRCVLDFFDVVSILVFARCVDSLDGSVASKDYSTVWPDILAGLYFMFDKDGFKSSKGEYFAALRAAPNKFIKPCPAETVEWLKELRNKGKFVFLLTGSAMDFASFTASTSMGQDWQDLFDLIICFARKPGFFFSERSFVAMNGTSEGDPCTLEGNKTQVISQGNWKELEEFLRRRTGKEQPRVIYVGDNAVQDVLAPVHYNCCEALAVIQELTSSLDPIVGASAVWGSYLQGDSLWRSVLQKNSSLVVPSLKTLAALPIETRLNPSAFLTPSIRN